LAFKLYKASGARVPDIVSSIGAGTTLGAAPTGVVSGVALTIDTDGLEIGATSDKIAGVCVVDYGTTVYYGTSTATFPDGIAAGTEIPFLPATGTVLFKADINGTVAKGAISPGEDLDIAAGGASVSDASVNDDFHVVKVIDDGTNITHVVGFFNNPGYFAS